MNYQWIYKKSRLFFIISILSLALIWLGDIFYSKYNQYRSGQNQIIERDVLLGVAMKASGIISTNNPGPIVYSTIKRIVIRSPHSSIAGYVYSDNLLKVKVASNVNLFEISKLFNYLPYTRVDNDYEIKI